MMTITEVKEIFHDEKNVEVMFQNLNVLDRTAIFADKQIVRGTVVQNWTDDTDVCI